MVAPSPAPAPGAGASLAATALLMVNNTVGAGLLALPYVLLRSGLVPGLCAMALTGTLNCLMAVLLAQNCALCGARSYAELATHAFGARAAWAISLLMAVYTLGSCASYAVLLGDALPELADSGGGGGAGAATSVFAARAVLLPACAALVLFPLSAQRNLKSLRFTAAAAVLCILYVAGLVLSRAARAPRAVSAVDYSAGGGAGLFVGIPITMVRFTCHYNVPRMYFELEARSVRRLAAAAAACFGFALALYLSTAAAGYVLFGAATKNDILADFADDDVAALVARVALVVVMSFSFPIVFNNFRAMTVSLLPQALQDRIDIMGKAGAAAGEGGEGGAKRLGDDAGGAGGGGGGCCSAFASAARDWPFLLTTAVLVAACVLVAAAVPDLGLILGYKGALGASFILYILPGAFYFALVRRARRRAAAAPLDESAVGVGVGAGAGATPAMTPRRVPAMRFLSFAFGAGTTAAAGALSARSTASGAGGGFFRALQSAGAAAGGGGGGGAAGDGADAEDARATHTPLLWAATAAVTPAGSEAASAASPSPSLTPAPTPKPLPLSIGEGGEGEEAFGGGEGASLVDLAGELLTTRHGLVALALGLWGGTVLVLGTLTTAGALKL